MLQCAVELEALKRRDPEALGQIVRAHAGDLLRGALAYGASPDQAEELVQASFTAFLEGLDRFEGRSSIKTYLFGILYRKALEAGRKRVKEQAVDPADAAFEGRFNGWGHWNRAPEGPEGEADTAETARLIGDCLAQLPDQQRAAFQLKEVDRLEAEEACNVLGVQPTHLRVLLFRARTKLRDCLEAKWGKK